MLMPAEPIEILQAIAKLRLHFPTSHLKDSELKALLSDYLQDMSSYPIDLIEKACVEYRRNHENLFFPKLGQLLKLMDDHWYKRLSKLKKLKILLKNANGE